MSESWLDVRSRIVSLESEIDNLNLLLEYGESAWAHDLNCYSQIIELLETQLSESRLELTSLETNLSSDEEKFEKDLGLAERDLFNYIRNNTKVSEQVNVMEEKVKELYSDLKELDMSNDEIDSKFSSVF